MDAIVRSPSPRLRVFAGCLAAACAAAGTAAHAGSFGAGDLEGTWKVTLNYGVGIRMEDPDPALIDGPIDKFEPAFFFPPSQEPSNPGQILGFGHTGLPTTINFDDGNRNFDKYSLINNRASIYGEMSLRWGNFGGVASGAAFYDWVFQQPNDNDQPEPQSPTEYDTVNTRGIPNNEFTPDTVATNGERLRMLESYVYGDFWFDAVNLNLRYGRHLNAWGESLFFPGIVSGQNPNDATKAFAPGAEVKEILLPVNQVSLQLGIGSDWTVLGYYQLEFKPTEVFPVGDFFSPADAIGPGATFVYGSANPANGTGCPGLFENAPNSGGVLQPLEALCLLAPGTVIDAGPTIDAERGPDIVPDAEGQWGFGTRYQITGITNLGAYYLRYHNHNPSVQLNVGFARIGTLPVGIPGVLPSGELTTELFMQYVPTSYQVVYADDIEMQALSFSSVFFGINFAGELIHRENINIPVEATISGVVAPVDSRGSTNSLQISGLYTTNPDFLFYDEVPIVGEIGYVRVQEVTPKPDEPGINYSGNGDTTFFEEDAWAVQLLMLPKGRNVWNGWDLLTPISFAWLVEGTPSTPGQFGPLFGEGDMRLGLGAAVQFLQNLEFSFNYNLLMGDPQKKVGNSTLPANPYADHDYATLNVKYNL